MTQDNPEEFTRQQHFVVEALSGDGKWCARSQYYRREDAEREAAWINKSGGKVRIASYHRTTVTYPGE